jgi:hypothetical protein
MFGVFSRALRPGKKVHEVKTHLDDATRLRLDQACNEAGCSRGELLRSLIEVRLYGRIVQADRLQAAVHGTAG